jgi:nucleoside-diphosphate-sugar epimerase
MKILVTGAAGFIGKHLTAHLTACGYDLVAIDYQDGDLREDGMAEYFIAKHRPQVVIHLAAQVGIYFNEQDCVHAINSNAVMTLRVAKACAKYGARLMHTSTSEVYGDYGDKFIDEDAPLVGKCSGIYAISKRWSEDAAAEYAPEGLVIIRPSMPYGTGAPVGKGRRAMDNMLWQAHHRKPITVHRGAVRSWCWVGDLVKGYQMILEAGAVGAFNIGRDDDERSMLWLAQEACKIAGAPVSLIQEVEPPQKKTMIKRLSTAKLRALGWRPTVELADGLPIMYQWAKRFPWEDVV